MSLSRSMITFRHKCISHATNSYDSYDLQQSRHLDVSALLFNTASLTGVVVVVVVAAVVAGPVLALAVCGIGDGVSGTVTSSKSSCATALIEKASVALTHSLINFTAPHE